jgi:hypothetical protein
MSRYEYKINDDLVLEMWDNENPNEYNAPFLRQPINPNTNPWQNRQEVEEYAEDLILMMLGLKETIEQENIEIVP